MIKAMKNTRFPSLMDTQHFQSTNFGQLRHHTVERPVLGPGLPARHRPGWAEGHEGVHVREGPTAGVTGVYDGLSGVQTDPLDRLQAPAQHLVARLDRPGDI